MEIANNLIEFAKAPIEKRRETYVPLSLRRKISTRDCGEKLVPIADFFASKNQKIFLSSVWSKNDIPVMLLREGVAEKLYRAVQKISGRYYFKITDAYRPISLQRKLFSQVCDEIRTSGNCLSEEEIKTRARRFVADPDFGVPPHSTGGVVDLTLMDEYAGEVDMGTGVDALDDRAETMSSQITKKQLDNRMLLLNVMENEGFVNLASEWWHYSYGDQYWAAFFGKAVAIYDSI